MNIDYYYYNFKDSKTTDNVAKTLLFVGKFSKNQALVRISDSSISVVWGGSPKTYYIHAECTALDMFKNRQELRPYGLDHCKVISVDPVILGKTLKCGTQDRNVSLCIGREHNMLQVEVKTVDNSSRTITHRISCEIKSLDDYKSMLIGEVERNLCRYDTNSIIDNIHRFKHIIDSFVKLTTQKIYIWSKQSDQGNDLTINTRTQGAIVNVSLSDLDNGFEDLEGNDRYSDSRRLEAGVNVDVKRLSLFLSSAMVNKRSKVSFKIEHNKCLKVTLVNEQLHGEKSYQSLLLLHSLNN